jgi:hypothetical protein
MRASLAVLLLGACACAHSSRPSRRRETDAAATGQNQDAGPPSCAQRAQSITARIEQLNGEMDVPRVRWDFEDGVAGATSEYEIDECSTLMTDTTYDNGTTTHPKTHDSRSLPCISSHTTATPTWSVADVQNALGHPDVRAALAAKTTFGGSTGHWFNVYTEDGSISFDDSVCSPSPCVIPPAVTTLRELLEAIAHQAR